MKIHCACGLDYEPQGVYSKTTMREKPIIHLDITDVNSLELAMEKAAKQVEHRDDIAMIEFVTVRYFPDGWSKYHYVFHCYQKE